MCPFSSRRVPGGSSFEAAVTFWRSCSAMPESFWLSSGALIPGVTRAFVTAAPSSAELLAITETLSM